MSSARLLRRDQGRRRDLRRRRHGLISPSATNATLTSQGFKTFHRVVPTDYVEGTQAADWLAKKAKNVFVVDDLTDYGKGVADAVEAELKAKGVTVTRQGVDAEDHRLQRDRPEGEGLRCRRDVLRRLRRPGRAARQGAEGGRLQGPDDDRQRWEVVGVHRGCRRCRRRLVLLLRLPGRHRRPGAKDFTDAYKKMFNTAPSTYSPEAYDATNA